MTGLNSKPRLFLLLPTLLTLLISCEDVINVKLKDSSPRLVIEGSVSNISDSVIISLHKSTDYFSPSLIASVDNATVSITDAHGTVRQLTSRGSGKYSVNHIHAIPGDSFSLNVSSEGVDYSATSTVPELVSINGIVVDKRPNHPNENRVSISFTDPAGTDNYYRVKVYRNNVLLNDFNRFSLYSDKYFDGKENTITLNARRFDIPRFEKGDILRVQLVSLDKTMYNYYQILGDITEGENFLSASTPSNPPNNLSNGALGYFATWSVNEKIVLVK